MSWVQPLDLQSILINHLAGSTQIFLFLSLIFIAILAGVFRFANYVLLATCVLFFFMFADYFSDVYFLMIVLLGLIIGYSIGVIIKR